MLCNRGDANAQGLARGVVRVVLGAPSPAPPPLVAHLSALETAAHPGDALEEFGECAGVHGGLIV